VLQAVPPRVVVVVGRTVASGPAVAWFRRIFIARNRCSAVAPTPFLVSCDVVPCERVAHGRRDLPVLERLGRVLVDTVLAKVVHVSQLKLQVSTGRAFARFEDAHDLCYAGLDHQRIWIGTALRVIQALTRPHVTTYLGGAFRLCMWEAVGEYGQVGHHVHP
jgi:hypothetical protein